MNPGQRALAAGLGLAVIDGLLLALLFANTCCGDSPNGFVLLIAFLLGLAATVLTQIGIIAWGVELGNRRLALSLIRSTSTPESGGKRG
jgi:RsiW-degrading membrane proteinase PrsW (M82 family)